MSNLHSLTHDSSSYGVHNSLGRIEPDACGCGSDTGCDDFYDDDTESGCLRGPDSSNDRTGALNPVTCRRMRHVLHLVSSTLVGAGRAEGQRPLLDVRQQRYRDVE